jgi:hypothetical protein
MSTTTLAMRIKKIMTNMPDSINTKKGINEYYKNSMMMIIDIKKTNSKIIKIIAKKSNKNYQQNDSIELPEKSTVLVISNIVLKVQDTTYNKSQFTKDIEKTAELLKNKKINKKEYISIYNYDIETSFATKILVAAYKINKSLL